MAVSHTVFLAREKLPTRDAWQRALEEQGFSLVLPRELDPATEDGHVACMLAGVHAGFEYFVQHVDTYIAQQECPERRELIGERDCAVSFITHARFEDLKAAVVAGAVLATMSYGLMWSDEAGDFIANPIAAVRELEVASTQPVAVVVEAQSLAVDLIARCVFRGHAMSILETSDATPRRFTVKLGIVEPEVHIIALWHHPIGSDTVHWLRDGDAVHELDPAGTPKVARPIATSIAELGTMEIATRELLAAGPAAVAPLCLVAADPDRPTQVRQMAIVILGELRDRRAAATLEVLMADAELGASARQALAKLPGR